MIVGVMVLDLFFEKTHSLKEKRHILSSLKGKLCNRFNISLIESDYQDLWQKTQIAVSIVSNSKMMCDKIFNQIEDFIFSNYSIQLINLKKEYF
jgi:uncharacterized protein YlxP (DUF503 family)